jgi:hypothetical protein
LPEVIGGVPDAYFGQAQARVGPGIWSLDGVIHVLRSDLGERFLQRNKGVAQIDEQFGSRFRRTRAAFIAGLWWRATIEFGCEGEIAAGNVASPARQKFAARKGQMQASPS